MPHEPLAFALYQDLNLYVRHLKNSELSPLHITHPHR